MWFLSNVETEVEIKKYLLPKKSVWVMWYSLQICGTVYPTPHVIVQELFLLFNTWWQCKYSTNLHPNPKGMALFHFKEALWQLNLNMSALKLNSGYVEVCLVLNTAEICFDSKLCVMNKDFFLESATFSVLLNSRWYPTLCGTSAAINNMKIFCFFQLLYNRSYDSC